MRMPRPFQWIEEAEARRVITAAVSEKPVAVAAPSAAGAGAAAPPRHWLSVRRLLPQPPQPAAAAPALAADSLADSGG